MRVCVGFVCFLFMCFKTRVFDMFFFVVWCVVAFLCLRCVCYWSWVCVFCFVLNVLNCVVFGLCFVFYVLMMSPLPQCLLVLLL